jgi:uncharacterized membrane protein YgdD (TMEM256/DUF423 family)
MGLSNRVQAVLVVVSAGLGAFGTAAARARLREPQRNILGVLCCIIAL